VSRQVVLHSKKMMLHDCLTPIKGNANQRREQSENGAKESEFCNSLCISHLLAYSPSLSSKCTLIPANFSFKSFGQNHPCKYLLYKVAIKFSVFSILSLLVSEPVPHKLIYCVLIYCIYNLHRANPWWCIALVSQ